MIGEEPETRDTKLETLDECAYRIDVAWGTLLGSALAGEVLVYAECSRWYLHVCFSNPRVVAGLAAAQEDKILDELHRRDRVAI